MVILNLLAAWATRRRKKPTLLIEEWDLWRHEKTLHWVQDGVHWVQIVPCDCGTCPSPEDQVDRVFGGWPVWALQ